MGQGFGVSEVIDRHEFDIAVMERSSEHVPPDASESVDAYFNCHSSSGTLTLGTDRKLLDLEVERKC
jgi:hypothetical protein